MTVQNSKQFKFNICTHETEQQIIIAVQGNRECFAVSIDYQNVIFLSYKLINQHFFGINVWKRIRDTFLKNIFLVCSNFFSNIFVYKLKILTQTQEFWKKKQHKIKDRSLQK